MQSPAERGEQQACFASTTCLCNRRRAYNIPFYIASADTEQSNTAGPLQLRSHSALLANPLLCCSGKMRLS